MNHITMVISEEEAKAILDALSLVIERKERIDRPNASARIRGRILRILSSEEEDHGAEQQDRRAGEKSRRRSKKEKGAVNGVDSLF